MDGIEYVRTIGVLSSKNHESEMQLAMNRE
jgi:hypothetical protein